jgi:hypothetical protein
MQTTGPSSVSLIICESVLSEKTGGVSAIRIMDVLSIGPQSLAARFFVISYLHSSSMDFQQHFAKVHLVALRNGQWVSVAEAPDHGFIYSYRLDPTGPGAFLLTTEFNLDLTDIGELGTFWVQLMIDGQLVAQTPIMLRRKT